MLHIHFDEEAPFLFSINQGFLKTNDQYECFKIIPLKGDVVASINNRVAAFGTYTVDECRFIFNIDYSFVFERCDRPLLSTLGIPPKTKVIDKYIDFSMFENKFNNALYPTLNNIDNTLLEEKKLQDSFSDKSTRSRLHSKNDKTIGSEHLRIQGILQQTGSIANTNTFIAKNDSNKSVNRYYFNEMPYQIDTIPDLDNNHDSRKTIELIDVLWVQNEKITHAFEVETSTSIMSGALRLIDLRSSVSHSIQMYIVVPKTRLTKAIKELSRPSSIALQHGNPIQIIEAEKLELLYKKIVGLDGFISSDIVEKISFSPFDPLIDSPTNHPTMEFV